MERDALRHTEALNAFWDDVALGRAPVGPHALDGETVDLVGRLHALGDSPERDSARERVWRDLQRHRRWKEPDVTTRALSPNGIAGSPVGPGLLPWAPPARPTVPMRWAPDRLATAVLVLLVLAGSMLVFGPGRPGQQNDTLLVLPSISGTPATPEVVVTETLLDAPATLPAGPATFDLTHWTLRPDSPPLRVAARNSLGARREGPIFIVVESGNIVITEAGTEHRLAAGEVYAATDPDQEVAVAADGPEHATAFVVPVLSDSALPISYDPKAHVEEFFWSFELDAVAGGAGRLVLERLTLAPSSALPWEEANPLVWTGVRAGTLGLTLEGDQLAVGWTAGQEQHIQGPGPLPSAGARPLPSLPAGTRILLRNAGDEPLVLYRLTLTPHDAGASAAGTPGP
ncbi:MAG: hypothetical protein H0V00_13900 [Chloroflexia bacterium]|nr:hypothetical protein [Chloroflexia bacterium]